MNERKGLILKLSLLSVVMIIAFTKCRKDSDCKLQASAPAQGSDMIFVYEAKIISGQGSISSLTYVSSNGEITVENPRMPWRDTVLVPGAVSASVSAVGTIEGGRLQLNCILPLSHSTWGNFCVHN
ncbi:MAG: hypothetical protein WCO93_09085 [bacterium]